VDALLAEGCTVVVPTFTAPLYLVEPPEAMRPDRNGVDYEALDARAGGANRVFTPETNDVNSTMGAIPAEVLARAERVRGSNQLGSFAALGPLADRVREQRPLDAYAPLRILAAKDGWALLIGVDLRSLTLLHLAEEKAGRRLFRRWANGPDGKPMEVEAGVARRPSSTSSPSWRRSHARRSSGKAGGSPTRPVRRLRSLPRRSARTRASRTAATRTVCVAATQ